MVRLFRCPDGDWAPGYGNRALATSGLPEWESIVVSSASVCVPRPRAESALGRGFGTMQPPLLVPPELTEQPRVRVRTNSLPGKPKPGPGSGSRKRSCTWPRGGREFDLVFEFDAVREHCYVLS